MNFIQKHIPLLFLILFIKCTDITANPVPPHNHSHIDCQPFNISSKLIRQWVETGNFQDILKYSTDWINTYKNKTDDSVLILHHYANICQAYLALDNTDSAKIWLDRSEILLQEITDKNYDNIYFRHIIYLLYNTLARYQAGAGNDYHTALSYLIEGLKLSERYNDNDKYAVFAINFAVICSDRHDPIGLTYGKEIYDKGILQQDSSLIVSGAYVIAALNFELGNYGFALPFIEDALRHADQFYEKDIIYTLYANILSALGKKSEAEHYYKLALEYLDKTNATAASYTCLHYGKFLYDNQAYPEAIQFLEKGIDISYKGNTNSNLAQLYLTLSKANEAIGNYREALLNHSNYHTEAFKIFNTEKEYSINELLVKFDTEKKEREIERQKLEITRQNNRIQLLVFIVVTVGLIAGSIILLYHHKSRLYTQLLKQYRDKVNLISELEKNNEKQRNLNPISSTPEDRDIIFEKLEQLMKNDKIYRDPEITVSNVAKLIGSNRTYLSKTINEKTGLSFSYYINSYRLEEAIRTLSNPEDDIPLKALAYKLGFKSLTSLYNLFKNVIGETPAEFRRKTQKAQTETCEKAH